VGSRTLQTSPKCWLHVEYSCVQNAITLISLEYAVARRYFHAKFQNAMVLNSCNAIPEQLCFKKMLTAAWAD
jgi:hypothetical protein